MIHDAFKEQVKLPPSPPSSLRTIKSREPRLWAHCLFWRCAHSCGDFGLVTNLWNTIVIGYNVDLLCGEHKFRQSRCFTLRKCWTRASKCRWASLTMCSRPPRSSSCFLPLPLLCTSRSLEASSGCTRSRSTRSYALLYRRKSRFPTRVLPASASESQR